mmetsp:Transcript_5921/g.14607  ORF Transcript_5921/g.14607 Transcript_5921/m.14607 type:complete len:92 (+) Transcript_5921:835-1110(+)
MVLRAKFALVFLSRMHGDNAALRSGPANQNKGLFGRGALLRLLLVVSTNCHIYDVPPKMNSDTKQRGGHFLRHQSIRVHPYRTSDNQRSKK